MSREINGQWTRPIPMGFTSGYTDRDFTISPDGNSIYFGSNRPRHKGGKKLKFLDIFMTKRIRGNQWSEPENLGKPINTNSSENYPSIAQNKNLYFFSCRDDGIGGCDIYISKYIDGRYQPPENLGVAVNSDKHDWDAYIAPDESYIIFSSKDRKDSIGGQDLYISYKKQDGHWTQAKNMGPSVNSSYCEICPSVSLDQKFLFFTTRRRGKADIYWLDAKIIDKLKPKEIK
jgi:Tol biopolymer transport system component